MTFKNKLKLFNYIVIIFLILATVKLFQLQIVNGNQLKKQSFSQSYQLKKNNPIRGTIYSADNFPITSSITKYQVSIYKPNITDQDQLINQINQTITDIDQTDTDIIDSFFQNPNQKWISLKTYINKPQLSLLLDIDGLNFNPIEQRIYPENELFSDILGVLAKNKNGFNTGYGGLEGYYNQQIEGKPGYLWQTKDAIGQMIFTSLNWKNPKIDGTNLFTFLNRDFQFILDQELTTGLIQTQAESITGIIVESHTGAILAMTTKHASPSATTKLTNPAIASIYEPGSIFKPLVVSIGLDSRSIDIGFTCPNCNQNRFIDGYEIANWNFENHPDTNLTDIIKNSDNIGMTYVMDQIELDTFLTYSHLLGLSRKTGIDLQGEAKPNFDKNYWSKIEKATAAFGQGFAITPIQMIMAFNALATDGNLLTPRLVNQLTAGTDSKSTKAVSTKVFSDSTIKHIKSILNYNINNSNLTKLNTKNLDVCGKSGTAQVASGGVYGQDTIGSFVAFSPCQSPLYTMMILVQFPKSSPWGVSTAAPIWFKIANRMEFFLKML